VAFFLEWDSGEEPLGVWASKLGGYAWHMPPGVVRHGWCCSGCRRPPGNAFCTGSWTNLDPALPVATAARDSLEAGAAPVQAVWLVHGGSDAPRRLVDLADLGDQPPEPDRSPAV
jgi:hypothetical protein